MEAYASILVRLLVQREIDRAFKLHDRKSGSQEQQNTK